ncbi:hypothetical protein TUSST3_29160 [Streptomyces sp. TUS-ST3]|uniref:hypothetical protein n=1 Tax=Streptomyces sp. TUS-ST3 TaxID=3025591 RepID=UPI00235B5977|nr:hypothetical protein [Streptomyces sp. TUS-ST3]GLP66296.1 hypothetical protein TUSST3_29160 [Streptomyces sp. TUS-ST3]
MLRRSTIRLRLICYDATAEALATAGASTQSKVSEAKTISAELPAAAKKDGKPECGIGALPAGFPPRP